MDHGRLYGTGYTAYDVSRVELSRLIRHALYCRAELRLYICRCLIRSRKKVMGHRMLRYCNVRVIDAESIVHVLCAFSGVLFLNGIASHNLSKEFPWLPIPDQSCLNLQSPNNLRQQSVEPLPIEVNAQYLTTVCRSEKIRLLKQYRALSL
jgi:hypothetical protein